MIIIGDNMVKENMDREINLIDLNFNDFSMEEKRETFMILDLVMKKYHENGYMITSFDPKDIYYQNELFSFSKFTRISPLNANDRNDAILKNIIGLANLAFCCYLPLYDLSKGLLNNEVVSKYYDKFENRFVPMDRGYYRSVLVDGVVDKKLPDTPYYYDYVKKIVESNTNDRNRKMPFMKKNESNSSSENGNVRAFVKATEAGKLMTDNQEAAFSTVFALTCLVVTLLIATVGVVLYFVR